ncbi:MAG: hypothetical protein IT373_11390 [Polyangiaceae bacterium]|nr:hypothetical protein [Polyangiaceae bacterium]
MVTRSSRRVRLCLGDLYHQDVVEMIERETRKYELWTVESPDDPKFAPAYKLLWDAFGPQGEMEREEAIRKFVLDDPYEPTPGGTFFRYFLLLATDRDGNVRGARDGSVLINPSYAPDLCVVYLSHIYMTPQARGTVLSYWLRIAPTELAVHFLADLHALGRLALPLPDAPGKYFGMRVNLTAEMEYWTPEDRLSLQRLLFYGRGGFDAVNPRHFPYRQPDFREPELIRATGSQPKPFVILLRRMGRERQATLPLEEARATMRLLYDEFASHCQPEMLENSLQIVLDRLAERSKTKSYVELLPLPTGARDIARLKRLFRYSVFRNYYRDEPATRAYMQGGIRERLRENPKYVDEALAKIAADLEARPAYVYGSRQKAFAWNGLPTDTAETPTGDLPEPVSLDLHELSDWGELARSDPGLPPPEGTGG